MSNGTGFISEHMLVPFTALITTLHLHSGRVNALADSAMQGNPTELGTLPGAAAPGTMLDPFVLKSCVVMSCNQ